MVGDSAFITTVVAMAPSVEVEDAPGSGNDLGGIRLGSLLEVLVLRHRHIGSRDPEHRRVQQVERLALDQVHDLGPDAGK